VILSDEIPSLGFLLRDRGRATAHFGKSHLGGFMYRNVLERKPYEGRWFHRRIPDENGFVYEKAEGGTGEDQSILGFDTWAGGWKQYHDYLIDVGLGDLLNQYPKPGNHNDLPSGPNTEHR
jgi:arylsulfatase A-like enzyme